MNEHPSVNDLIDTIRERSIDHAVQHSVRVAGWSAAPKEKAAQLLAVLPVSVRVGPFDYAIIQIDEFESVRDNHFGQCDANVQEIRIYNRLTTPAKVVDVLMHELLHAIWAANFMGASSDEEPAVARIGTSLVALHRDNPWLAPWLAEACS